MVYVTHDQTEAMTMADQVILLRRGRVEQDAPPAEMYARPATAFAARFIGTPPMNLLRLATAPGRLVGVRPEDVRFADAGLAVRITSVEYLGADSIVACTAGADTLAVRVAGRVELAEGKHAHVTWAPAAQHFFDVDTGRRIP
jgi:sn-glycerol 3-phosphate transport system ATP-binding protein